MTASERRKRPLSVFRRLGSAAEIDTRCKVTCDSVHLHIHSHRMHALRIIRIVIVGLIFLPVLAAYGLEPQLAAEDVSQSTQQHIASTNADPTWRPSPEQQAFVLAATRAYFAARDSNRVDDAYAFLSPRQKQYVQQSTFQGLLEDFNAKSGPVQSRRLRSVTWYKDTPQAGPGLYVAVDYSSEFTNLALHCGYVVWHEQPDGQFLQVREEVNVVDKATMAKLKPGDFEKVRTHFRC